MTEDKSLRDRLLEEAEKEDRLANQLKGCSFMGEWPGARHQERASLLRQAALTMRKVKNA